MYKNIMKQHRNVKLTLTDCYVSGEHTHINIYTNTHTYTHKYEHICNGWNPDPFKGQLFWLRTQKYEITISVE